MIPAYFTAMGTMSSAATLPVALECARKVPFLKKESVSFCIPLFNIAHLPGAAAAITMSAMVVTILTKGQTPSLEIFLPLHHPPRIHRGGGGGCARGIGHGGPGHPGKYAGI